MHETLFHIIDFAALIVEAISAVILLIGFLKILYRYMRVELGSKDFDQTVRRINFLRHDIGTYILLGLDFYIIADILASMTAPDMDELIRLGVIVLLRTIIAFFLGREVMEIEEQHKRSDAAEEEMGV